MASKELQMVIPKYSQKRLPQ